MEELRAALKEKESLCKDAGRIRKLPKRTAKDETAKAKAPIRERLLTCGRARQF
jgi:hypothetical protein